MCKSIVPILSYQPVSLPCTSLLLFMIVIGLQECHSATAPTLFHFCKSDDRGIEAYSTVAHIVSHSG